MPSPLERRVRDEPIQLLEPPRLRIESQHPAIIIASVTIAIRVHPDSLRIDSPDAPAVGVLPSVDVPHVKVIERISAGIEPAAMSVQCQASTALLRVKKLRANDIILDGVVYGEGGARETHVWIVPVTPRIVNTMANRRSAEVRCGIHNPVAIHDQRIVHLALCCPPVVGGLPGGLSHIYERLAGSVSPAAHHHRRDPTQVFATRPHIRASVGPAIERPSGIVNRQLGEIHNFDLHESFSDYLVRFKARAFAAARTTGYLDVIVRRPFSENCFTVLIPHYSRVDGLAFWFKHPRAPSPGRARGAQSAGQTRAT